MTLSLTPKNACSGVTALSGGILTIIMGAIPADNLHNWKWPIIVSRSDNSAGLATPNVFGFP